ncbi:ZP domain-containing protein [Trichonephila clavipes]|nr:ZP domain-containing protein [Trichonephila clavipes]
MNRHSRVENGVVILVWLFFISIVSCGTVGSKLGYKSGIFKDFVSEKTRVSLACRSNDIMVNLNFSVPFRGLVHAGKKDSGCSFRGDGKLTYSLNVPHAACGTVHVTPQDSFANTLTIRYHHALELEGDEIKTILCKYGTGSIQLG